MEQDFQFLLGLMIDESDLSDIQKRIAKEKINLNANISIEDFSKSKLEMEKQIASLGTYIKTTLGDAVTDKQANKWAKKYYDSMISGAKQATKEQEKLNDAQKKDTLATQKKYYENIINTNKQLYSLKSKLLTSDETQTTEINKQVKALERRNKYYSSQITKKGLTDNTWEKSLNDSKNVLENELKINKAKLVDTSNSKSSAEQEKLANSMSKVREQTELARQAEEKRQQSAQNNAINKNIEQEFIQREKLKTQIDEINKVEQLGTNKSKVASFTNDLKNYTNESKIASDQIKNLQNVHNTLLTSQANLLKGTGNETDLINSNKLLQEEYTKTANVLNNLKTEFGKGGSALAAPEQVSATISKINKYMAQNTKITDEARIKLKAYKSTLSEADVTKGALNDVKTGLAGIESQMRELNKVGFSFADKFKNAITKFGGWALATGTVMQSVQKVKEAIVELKEVNTILTEISKANDTLTKSQLTDLGNIAFKKGSKYGKGASSYLSGIQEASRAGYSNADDIAELSVLAQSAGDMTAELANKYVIATDAAYKLRGETSKLNEVLDGQNYITNNNAVNMSELADATRVTASQAASSGVEIDKMTAAIGTMIAVTQDSGDTAGRAFKGILMNLQQVSGEVDATTGEIINDDDLRKYEAAANDLGVQLKEVKDGYMALRDPMQILKDLSQAYTSLPKDDSRRANLISAIGGKYRGNQLNALLENWNVYEKMLSEYSQGTGSAMTEAMKSANNWEGSLAVLNNTWTDLVGNFVNSDNVITFLKTLNGALSVVNTTTEKLGSLGTIGTVGAGAGLFAFFKNLDQLCCKFCLENLCRSNIDKEMIKWFKVQIYMFGSSKINQRGLIAGSCS